MPSVPVVEVALQHRCRAVDLEACPRDPFDAARRDMRSTALPGRRTGDVVMDVQACPCHSGKRYAVCCRPLHEGLAAPSAVALMRSRYCAYALGLEKYLRLTWHASTRPAALELDTEPRPRWIGLEIRRQAETGSDCATVEFVARYKVGGRAYRLHETSRFRREDDRWYYVDGDLSD